MHRVSIGAVTVAAFVILGCAGNETADQIDSAATAAAPAAADAAPNVVTFTATEFSFDGPREIPAGVTTFRLVGAGKELHHLQIIKLTDGKTFDDLQAAIKAGGPPPAWAVEYGGVNPPAPGEETAATQVMEPGNYAVVCFVESADKVPHLAKGMVAPLTVTPSATASAVEPKADVVLTLNDYKFDFDKPLTAGRHTIRVENAASQPHEIVLVQLAPGKNLEDLMTWLGDMKGPPPGKPLGGIPGFPNGKTTYFDVDLTAGEYALICFVPDHKDGKPHFQHGMMSQIRVS